MPEPILQLQSLPHQVYKVTDAGHTDTESWCFWLLIQSEIESLTPHHANVQLMSGDVTIKTLQYSQASLEAIQGLRFRAAESDPPTTHKHYADQNELFDLRFVFSEEKSLNIDSVNCQLELKMTNGETIIENTSIGLQYYSPKTELIFPVKGPCIILQDYFNNGGHTEWSTQFAIDIFGLTSTYAIMTAEEYRNETLAGWGREIIAPADGIVMYIRNDVPDQPQAGISDKSTYESLPEPIWAIGGNSVVIDHQNDEFSFLMHFQMGSVLVEKGEYVKQGQVLGRLGNAGNSSGPHLHYHLQDGPKAFAHDGLPLRFTNLPDATFPKGTFLSTD